MLKLLPLAIRCRVSAQSCLRSTHLRTCARTQLSKFRPHGCASTTVDSLPPLTMLEIGHTTTDFGLTNLNFSLRLLEKSIAKRIIQITNILYIYIFHIILYKLYIDGLFLGYLWDSVGFEPHWMIKTFSSPKILSPWNVNPNTCHEDWFITSLWQSADTKQQIITNK